MKGDPDNIVISDADAYDHEEFMNIHHPEPKAKPKAVPVKKTAVKRAEAPRDRGSDSARRPNTARHAKPGEPVYGDYPATPTGPAMGGKHGKSWDGKA